MYTVTCRDSDEVVSRHHSKQAALERAGAELADWNELGVCSSVEFDLEIWDSDDPDFLEVVTIQVSADIRVEVI